MAYSIWNSLNCPELGCRLVVKTVYFSLFLVEYRLQFGATGSLPASGDQPAAIDTVQIETSVAPRSHGRTSRPWHPQLFVIRRTYNRVLFET